MLTFFLNTGFVSNATKVEKEADRQEKFLDFLSYFEKVSLPYSMNLKDFECTAYSKKGKFTKSKISTQDQKFFQKAMEFLPPFSVVFSRTGRPYIQPVARFFPDDETVAIIFSSSMQFHAPTNKNYTLVCYDLKGNLLGYKLKNNLVINNQRIGFTNLHQCQVFTILPSGKIKTTLYGNDWASKVGTVALEENKLLGFKKLNEVNYKLAGVRGIQEISSASARP